MNTEKCVALLPIYLKSAQSKSPLSCWPGDCPDCPFSLSNSKERAWAFRAHIRCCKI